MTYTYVEMDVSQSTYDEVKAKLREAGYEHAIGSEGALDMHGLALVLQPEVPPSQKTVVEGFLCRAWGETALPEVRLVRTDDDWKAFVAEAQWGPDVIVADLDEEDRLMLGAQVGYIAQDMADNNEGEIDFEIGGVSVSRATFDAAATK